MCLGTKPEAEASRPVFVYTQSLNIHHGRNLPLEAVMGVMHHRHHSINGMNSTSSTKHLQFLKEIQERIAISVHSHGG